MSDEPTIKPKSATPRSSTGPAPDPRRPTPALRDLIPIEASSGPIVKPGAKVDAYTFYLDYYRSDDKDRTDPDKLRKIVRDLNRIGRFRELHAALVGYLRNHPRLAEPWMYEALASAIELNRGSPADVKTALNYAADLAQRSHNPNHLVSAADKLMVRGYLDRVGTLLDEAIAQVPHRSEPLAMDVNLAQKTKDANRMADAIERLLSLGWPGQDEYFRVEAANQVDTLAKTLREEGKGQEADALFARLTASQARDLFIRLTWDGDADYDLVVDEPLGATASFQAPRTVFGGSIIKNGYGNHPEEVYVCPRGFNGDYTIRVTNIYSNPSSPVTRLTLETITHEGSAGEKKETHSLSPDKSNKPVVVHLMSGRRKKVLPFVDPAAELMKAMKNIKPPANAGSGSSKGASAAEAKMQQPANDAAKGKKSTSVHR
jgi:hypothetical protein